MGCATQEGAWVLGLEQEGVCVALNLYRSPTWRGVVCEAIGAKLQSVFGGVAEW